MSSSTVEQQAEAEEQEESRQFVRKKLNVNAKTYDADERFIQRVRQDIACMSDEENVRIQKAVDKTKELVMQVRGSCRALNSVRDIKEELQEVYALTKADAIHHARADKLVYALQALCQILEREQVETRMQLRDVKSLNLYAKGLGAHTPLARLELLTK